MHDSEHSLNAGYSREEIRNESHPASRRGYLRALALGALASVGAAGAWAAASRIAAGRDAIDPEKLLLAPQDFPDMGLKEVQRPEPRETRNGGHAAQAVLERNSFRLYHSVVVFPNEGAAQQAMEALRYGEAEQLGEPAAHASRYGNDSLILSGHQGAEEAVSVVFRRGHIFERLTLTGTEHIVYVGRYAQRADEKVGEWRA